MTKALTAPEIKTAEDLRTAFLHTHRELTEFVEKANGEILEARTASAESLSALRALTEKAEAIGVRLDKMEARSDRGDIDQLVRKNLGDQFVDSPDWKSSIQLTMKAKARMETKAIVNATGQNQPLVADMRVPGIITTPNRRLRMRQLIPVGQTSSNLVQFARENVFTNNAGPQAGGSPTVPGENLTKPESDITFTLANAAVITLAHFILASRQVLEDAPMLASYINGRLQYGLALEEDDELLNGDGTVGTVQGLMAQATGFNRATTGTKIDWLRRAITQLQLSEYDAEFIVLNPADWEEIELVKATDNQYVVANPISMMGPTLWGLPVVATNTMRDNQFLVANGSMAAQIWDRQSAAIEVSREDSDNFRKNMVTILAEERLALTVYRPTALIRGVFSV
jgi:HK97 family phage major capsid protein